MSVQSRSRCLGCFFFLGCVAVGGSEAVAISFTPSFKTPQIVISGVDPALQQGDRFLAYDNLGVPSIATASGFDLFFSRQVAGVGWTSIGLPSSGAGGANGASIAFDRREQPAVAFGDTDGLHHVTFDASTGSFIDTLVLNTTGTSVDYSGGTSVAFDQLGVPAIAAIDSNGGGVTFVTDNNGDGLLSFALGDALQNATVFSDLRPNLAFDGLNRPVIAGNDVSGFIDVTVGDPFTGFNTLSPVSGIGPGASSDPNSVTNGSLAIDPDDGLPAIAWTDQSTGQLFYAKWDPLQSQFVTEFVDVAALGAELGNESLAFDPADGNPAISYSDEVGNLMFAYHDGTAWNTQFVLNTGVVGATRTSLDFNEFGDGFAAIAYINAAGDVFFTPDPPAVAAPEPAAAALLAFSAALACGRRATKRNR